MRLKFFNVIRYETFILVGFLIIIGVSMKLLGFYNLSSDWFWLLAGVGLIIEGLISLLKQKKFDRKYKVIEIPDLKDSPKKV